jgi:hypothetical protein
MLEHWSVGLCADIIHILLYRKREFHPEPIFHYPGTQYFIIALKLHFVPIIPAFHLG